MSSRRNFNREYVEQRLRELGRALNKKITVFIAGGAAMSFYGLKEATKDIDVALQNKAQVNSIISALKSLGYMDPHEGVTVDYARMNASAILENSDGFRWDVFEKVVANKLFLSKGMIKRSSKLFNEGNLQARLLSKEDVFLLKSVTDRDGDIDDMGIVAESGLRWEIIAKECSHQSSHLDRVWEDALCNRLIDLRERRGVTAPIEKAICRLADKRILEMWIKRRVGEGADTVRDLARESGETEQVIRKATNLLARKKMLFIDRSTRPHRIATRKKGSS